MTCEKYFRYIRIIYNLNAVNSCRTRSDPVCNLKHIVITLRIFQYIQWRQGYSVTILYDDISILSTSHLFTRNSLQISYIWLIKNNEYQANIRRRIRSISLCIFNYFDIYHILYYFS